MKQLFLCLIVYTWGILLISSVLAMMLGSLSALAGIGFIVYVSVFSFFWLGAMKGLTD